MKAQKKINKTGAGSIKYVSATRSTQCRRLAVAGRRVVVAERKHARAHCSQGRQSRA